MNWFVDFQDIRDDHIIHPFSIAWGYSMKGNELASIGKGPISPREFVPLIDMLKEKHQEKIPELKNEKNYFVIMKILRRNKEKMTATELNEFLNISKKWSSNFYSIDYVTDKIFEYIAFVNSHFKQTNIANPLTKKPLT